MSTGISNKFIVRELSVLMAAHGVTRCVISPGSRNAPLSATFEAMGFECRGCVDERSAGFMAIGWAQQVREPVAVCVTSGSAALNLHPAVCEAYYRHIPLLVITADRPLAWIGQQDGQTLPQVGIYGNLVRYAACLSETESEWYNNRLINEAILELRHREGGPVHLNLPLHEPLFGIAEEAHPQARVIHRTEMAVMDADEEDALLARVAELPRRMILIGQTRDGIDIPPELVEEKQFVTVGEHLSNSPVLCPRPDVTIAQNPALTAPDLLITVGGDIISKRLKQLLRNNPPKEHWHVSRDGVVADTFCCQTLCIEGDFQELTDLLTAFAAEGDADYLEQWAAPAPEFTGDYSGMHVVGQIIKQLPDNSVLHLGNSSAVRYAQLFELNPGVQVECNRGVNGIEGCLSAMLGYAAGDTRLQVLLIGDLSFFYDMNALWQGPIHPNMRLVLLNNGCGGIFSTIPGTPDCSFVNAPHQGTAQAWAENCGFHYIRVAQESDLTQTIDHLFNEQGEHPVFIEVMLDAEQDAATLQRFYQSLS